MRRLNNLSESSDYLTFRSSVPLRNICVDNSDGKVRYSFYHIEIQSFHFLVILKSSVFQSWKVYDAGPKSVRCPLIFVPPACGTAEVYFRQILHLSACGYRVIAVLCFSYSASVTIC